MPECASGPRRVFGLLTVALDNELRFSSVVACNVELSMLSSAAHVEPIHPYASAAPFARSDSITSSIHSVGSGSGVPLQRRSRTRTRSSIALSKRGRSQGPPAGSSKYESDAGESFLDFDDAPPVPTLHDEPVEMTPTESTELKKSRRRSRTIGPESRPTYEGLRGDPSICQVMECVGREESSARAESGEAGKIRQWICQRGAW